MTTQREPTTYAPPSGVATWVTTNRDRRAFLLCCVSVRTSVHTPLTIVRLLAFNPRPSSPGDTACGLCWCGWVCDGDGGVRPRVMITLHIFRDPLTTPSFPRLLPPHFVEADLCRSLPTEDSSLSPALPAPMCVTAVVLPAVEVLTCLVVD